jgi:uncharacterized protein YndB with AHSA1/START domain
MTTPVNTVVETHINAPRSVVFAVLADRQSYGDVLPISTRLVSPGADGAQGIGAVHFLGLGPVGAKERITELVPDQRMAYEVVGGLPARRHTGEVELADEGVGTRMTYRMVHEPALPAPGFVLRPVLVGLTKALAGAVKKESERRAR